MSAVSDYCVELHQLISRKALTPLFQPILDLNNAKVIGYEALIRGPSNSPLHSPVLLFKTAMACNLLEPLEMLCREISIVAFAKANVSGLLFLNVNPLLLLTADHPSGITKTMLKQVNLDPARVVIEISEQYQVEEPSLLIKAVNHYRELGFSIAIDDLGSGFSGLKLWSEIKPDIIKIDRYFISQIHADPTKRAFVQNIVSLAKATGASIVAEGIETTEELLLCQELGANFGQGYLLGRPIPQLIVPPTGRYLLSTNRNTQRDGQEFVGVIALDWPSIDASLAAGAVLDLFLKSPSWHCLAVVDNGQAVGVVSKTELQEKFSRPYGRALYEKKPISQLMCSKPVFVDEHVTLDEVSLLVTEHEADNESWYFVITTAGRYLGIGSVRALLKKITERKLQHARYANPLTLLPGNVPIYQEIDRLLAAGDDFAVAYADLNYFKPYNDTYGYSRGDLVLQLLADVINQVLGKSGHFIGHIGGDDFVIIFTTIHFQSYCEQILQSFNTRIVHYYDEVDVNAGGIHALSRTGEACFYPLLSLAIGIAQPSSELCISHHDVAAITTSAKHEAKKLKNGGIFVSRRRGPTEILPVTLARPCLPKN